MNFLRRRIGRRIAIVVGLAMAAGGIGGVLLVVDQTSRAQAATTRRFLHAIARVVSASFAVVETGQKTHPIDDIVARLGHEDDLASLDVFSHNGRIHWSTQPGRLGTQVSGDALAVIGGTSRSEESPLAELIPSVGLGAKPVTVVVPLRMTSECRGCHANGPDPIGGLALTAKETHAKGGLALSRDAGVAVISYAILLTILLLFLIHRVVVARLSRLVQVMSIAEDGDFLVRAEVDAEDEIGVLSSAFNKMLAKITDLRVERIDAEREMTAVKDELDYQRLLSEKNELLEAANTRLSARIHQLSFLNELAHDLASRLDLDYVLDLFSERVRTILKVPQFAVLLLAEDKENLRVLRSRGFGTHDDAIVPSFPLGNGLSSEAVKSRKPIYAPNIRSDARKIVYRTGRSVIGSVLAVPIIYQDRVLGLLNFSSPVVDAFPPEDRELFVTIAHHAALALGNARLFEETLELTLSDGLTGLLNRRALEARLEHEWARAEREATPLSVVMIDIDHFKVYNDQNGHLLGDETLRRVARIIHDNTRKMDASARYGGEEFFVILPSTKKAEAIEAARKLRRSVEQADFAQGYRQPLGRVTISCGVATAPEDASSMRDLVHAADHSMLLAKQHGRNRVESANPIQPLQPTQPTQPTQPIKTDRNPRE